VSYNVSVTAPGAGSPTGLVTVTDGVDSCTGPPAGPNCKITFTTSGVKSLVATYPGDDNFQESTSAPFAYTVTSLSAVATITAHDPEASVVGQPVAMQFTVTSADGAPTGSVIVTDGTQSCGGTLNLGAGTCPIAFTSSGVKPLIAIYAGDSLFALDTSAVVTHAVNAFGAADTVRAVSGTTVDGTAGGTATPAPTVIVVDGYGNPVVGTTVTFTPGAGSGSASPSPTETGADGRANTVWTFGTGTGAQTLAASSGALPGVAFTAAVTPGAASLTTSTISAVPDTIPVGVGTSTITVRLFDANGNALTASGGTVALSASAGTLGTVTDNADGTYTATLTADATPGTATITGTLDGNALTDDATVTFTVVAG
jgi:adhesin/invasin